MTKSDLAEAVAARTNVPRADAEKFVDQVFDAMTEALIRGQRIELRGLGVFEVRQYEAYTGKNPRTGEPVAVKRKRLPFFKAGKEIRERLNRAAEQEQKSQQEAK
jgi:integration host factor subunit beta